MRNVPETIHAYNIPRLNWIFVLFSLLFVGSLVWMFWFDYIGYRDWKHYQKDFQRIEASRLQKEANEAEKRAAESGLADVDRQIDKQRELVAANEEKRKAAEAKVAAVRVKFEIADTQYRFRKADLDAQKYNHDVAFEHLHRHPDDMEAKSRYLAEKARLDAMLAEVSNLQLETQALDRELKSADAEVKQVVGEKEALLKERARLLAGRDLIVQRLQRLSNPLLQGFLNAPIIEIAQPTIKVKQIMVEDHRINVNFALVPRVDRCVSCHNSIEKRDMKTEGAVAGRTSIEEAVEKGDFRWADLPQPHTAHPRLDLFVSDTSPHPAATFGCSSCHWGWDRGMDFSRAAHQPDADKVIHTVAAASSQGGGGSSSGHAHAAGNGNGKPQDAASQEEFWKDKYHWHEMHHWEQKMRPSSFIESSCLKCHSGQTRIPEAQKLNEGIALIEQAGCYNCHKMKALETYVDYRVREGEDVQAVARLFNSEAGRIREVNGLRSDLLKAGMEVSVPVRALAKTGPSLYKMGGKLDKDWVRRWLAEPKRFRPNTFMPQFWGLESTYARLTNLTEHIEYTGVSKAEFRMSDREEVEIDAITEAIFAAAEKPSYPKPPVAGDAARGKQQVQNLGCMACHVVNERIEREAKYTDGSVVEDSIFPLLTYDRRAVPTLTDSDYKRSRSQGPMLYGSGSKMDVGWLYAWLKNPQQYHPDTKMPNLRLSDQEASDIAAFLVTLKSDGFDKRSLKDMSQELYRRVRDDMAQEYLESEYSKAEAEAIVKEGRFDEKARGFLLRVKYAVIHRLGMRWADIIRELEKFDGDVSETIRARGKSQIESLSRDARELAKTNPAAASLLAASADAIDKITPVMVGWNSLSAAERNEALATIRKNHQESRARFEKFAAAEAASIDLETKKKLFLGEKLIERYGCYSCHNIHGFESAKPIGVELSEWGSKLTSQLDFGYLEGKIGHNNYAYVQQKVKAPRSFDKTDVKRPQEWLKMPQYNFNAEQRKSIAIAIMGMTDEKPLPRARKNLTENEWQVENGRWMIKEMNCVGCHIIEKQGGAILATMDNAQKQMYPPNLSGIGAKLKPSWLYHFLQQPGEHPYRYWVNVRMPTFGLSDEQINILTRYFALLDKQNYPFENGVQQVTYSPPQEMTRAGEEIYKKFQCLKCHQVRPPEMAARASNIGPDMTKVKERMRPQGLVDWLRNPAALTPGVNMPANWPTAPEDPNPLPNVFEGSTEKQIQAVADYLLIYDGSVEKGMPLPKEEPAGGAAGGSEYE